MLPVNEIKQVPSELFIQKGPGIMVCDGNNRRKEKKIIACYPGEIEVKKIVNGPL